MDLMITSPGFMFLFAILGVGVFPGSNMIVSSFLAVLVSLPIAGAYALLSISYPRSGGEYVYVGRIITPSLGFMINFVFVIVYISVIGVEAVWISTFALGPMFSALGVILNNPGLTSAASIFKQPLYIMIIGTLSMLVISSVLFLGTGPAFRVKTILFLIAVFSVIVFIIVIGSTSHAQFVKNFNLLSPTSYQKYTSIVSSQNLPSGFQLSPTLEGTVYAVLAFLGFNFSEYVGGEVQNPKRSQFAGMFGSPIFYGILMIAVLFVSYNTFGYTFLTGISYASLSGSSSYTLPISSPWLSYIGAYATNNPYFVIIMTLGILATLFAFMLVTLYSVTRCLFAWTFDGLFPLSLSKVNEKYHVPTNALIVIIIVGVFFIYLTVYTSFAALFTYVVLASALGFSIVGIAAMVFPFAKKSTFESMPRPVSSKIGGVPVISLVGAACLIVSILIGYVAMLPAYIGVFSWEYVYFIASIFILGLVIYFVAYGIRKRQGIPVDTLLKEIPPE